MHAIHGGLEIVTFCRIGDQLKYVYQLYESYSSNYVIFFKNFDELEYSESNTQNLKNFLDFNANLIGF